MGVVLSAHAQEMFIVETEAETLTLKLEKRRGRFHGSEPQVRYRFVLVDRRGLPESQKDCQ
jgi:hypothetical protein